jgi:peptide-methionine (R)-S-oxide reductase
MTNKAYPVTHSDAEWRRILTPEQYQVMRSHGTEAPGGCTLLFEKGAVSFGVPAVVSRYLPQRRKFESDTDGQATI